MCQNGLTQKRALCSPKEQRDAAEEQAWARQAFTVSKVIQKQLPVTVLDAPMRKELESTTAELEADAIHTLR